jgi:hypothetical protein
MIAFDENGSLVDGSSVQALMAPNAPTPTDIFVMSHGWNNSATDAKETYTKLVQRMGDVADDFSLRPATYQPLVIGVRWPSKAWTEDEEAEESASPSARDYEARILAAIYENLPRSRASDVEYSRDVMRLQEILLTPDDTAEEFAAAQEIYRRYAIPEESPEEANVFAGQTIDDSPVEAFEEGGGFSLMDSFRVFTYWQMKARAGTIGRNGVNPLIKRLQNRFPAARLHLFGHSFGAKVVLASVADRTVARPVNTVVLLQPAISFWAFADVVPGTGQPGGYREALDANRVAGPIVVTFSRFDTALNQLYPLASRVAGQVGEQEESAGGPSMYSALGAVGAYLCNSTLVDMNRVGAAYAPLTHHVWSIDGGASEEFIGGHSDLDKDHVAWLLWSAVRASF